MRFVIYALFIFGSVSANAASPVSFNFSGQLTDTSNDPIISTTVRLKMRLLDPVVGTCLLYEENQDVNTDSNGRFVIAVGSDVGDSKRDTTNDHGLAMTTIFQNTSQILAPGSPDCVAGYTPAAGQGRFLQVTILRIGTGPVINEALTPQMIRSVPYAMVADAAESLQGKQSADFIGVNTVAPNALSQANVENVFTASNYAVLTALLNGTSTIYTKPAANGTLSLPNIPAPATPTAGQIWYDAGAVKYYNGTATVTLSGGGVTSITAGTGLAGGTITSAGTISLATSGVTASTYPKVTVDTYGRVTAGTTLVETDIPNLVTQGKVSGSAIDSGTIGGTTAISTTGNISSTGTITGATVSSSSEYTRNLRVYEAVGNEYTLIRSPALATNLDFTLPTSMGSAGNVLATDGAGNLSWTVPAATGVTSFNARTGAVVPAANDYTFAQINGSVADAQLSTNVALRAGANNFTNTNLFTNNNYFYMPTEFIGNGTPIQVKVTATGTEVPRIYGQRARGDYANRTATNSSDILLSVEGRGHNGTDFMTGAFMRMTGTQNWTAVGQGTQLSFGTTQDGAVGATEVLKISSGGQLGVLTLTPTANLHIRGGTASSNTAPLKINAGPVMTTPEAGAIEFDGTNLYYTDTTNTRRTLSTGGGTTASAVLASDGTSTAPSMAFAAEPNMGFYRSVGGRTSFSVGGVERFGMGSAGVFSSTTSSFYLSTGNSAPFPPFAFVGDVDTGMFRASPDTLGFSTGGTEKMRIDAGGNVGIGVTAPARMLHLSGPMRINPTALPGSANAGDLTFDSGDGNTLKYYNGSVWVSLNGTAGNFTNVTNIANAAGDITLSPTVSTGSVRIDSGTVSTSATTGALVVNGGIGVSGDITSNGSIGGSAIYGGAGYFPQLFGGINPSGTIRIDGTSNAMPGNIILATSGGKVGVGTNSPSANFDVTKTVLGSNINATNLSSNFTHSSLGGVSNVKAMSGEISYSSTAIDAGTVIGVNGESKTNNSNQFGSSISVNGSATHSGSAILSNIYGGKFSATKASGSGGITSAFGVTANVTNSSTGTISTAKAMEASVTNAGTIATAVGLDVAGVAGTSNAYGIRVGNVTATNKYSIYTSDPSAPIYFAGSLGIGSTPSTTSLFEVLHPSSSTTPKGVFIRAQDGNGVSGGITQLYGGYGIGSGNGGPFYSYGGEAGGTGSGGEARLQGGGAASGVGGHSQVIGGSSVGGAGGSVYITSGSSTSGAAGDINLMSGTGVSTGNLNISIPNTVFSNASPMIVASNAAANLRVQSPSLRMTASLGIATIEGQGGVRLGSNGSPIAAMGGCVVAITGFTGTYTNVTCTGVPSTGNIVVNCNHSATSSVPMSCRATGTANNISCANAAGISSSLNCMWWQF